VAVVPAELAFIGDRNGLPVHPPSEVVLHGPGRGPEPVFRLGDNCLGQARVLHVPVRAPEVERRESGRVKRPDVQHGLALWPKAEHLGDVRERADEADALHAGSLEAQQDGRPLAPAPIPPVALGMPPTRDVDEVDLEGVSPVLVGGVAGRPRGVALAGLDRMYDLHPVQRLVQVLD
jgi:hypothetical protein